MVDPYVCLSDEASLIHTNFMIGIVFLYKVCHPIVGTSNSVDYFRPWTTNQLIQILVN